MMMLGIISFYRTVLHREQGAILCDSWFHNLRFTSVPDVFAGSLCCDRAFILTGLSGRIVYFETHGKLRAFI